uniref:Costars family protein ABRACL n=1 Tax=Equus caballus TaxID=9796 RepID=A0A3Q2KWQ4_HORSE
MKKGRLVRSLENQLWPGRRTELSMERKGQSRRRYKEGGLPRKPEDADGKLSVKFGVLFRDDKCANLFEALVGTLKAAKRRKIVTYPGELLLQGVHDDVDIILLQD